MEILFLLLAIIAIVINYQYFKCYNILKEAGYEYGFFIFTLDPFVLIRYYRRNSELRPRLKKPIVLISILLLVFVAGGVLLFVLDVP